MIARLEAWAAVHPKAASVARHGFYAFAGAFVLFAQPWIQAVLSGAPVQRDAAVAAVVGGVAAGARAVGILAWAWALKRFAA